MKYFRYLAKTDETGSWIEYAAADVIRRLSFTVIGVIMLWWAWSLISSQMSLFPDVDFFTVIVGLFSLLLGIRNALSIIKDVSWGQAFLTLAFVAVMTYFVWFT